MLSFHLPCPGPSGLHRVSAVQCWLPVPCAVLDNRFVNKRLLGYALTLSACFLQPYWSIDHKISKLAKDIGADLR